ncbi:hypothetical protein SAMN04515674_11552 [Pseudarcicella hirudinis]|uniref:Cyclic nucleotide-binding domain-containing protein n=1 Tax=Pseudarcicella hirudinis TaxID=1079859 RepID=A0A1I5XLI6_9BACT|nr:Crp/Fnr family transcriptional regulator [Pseudarcicella hirudinis]SFQ32843.1 hypothetical protein SAMN04515674_11552 [Pseudarcicella hirudinis]
METGDFLKQNPLFNAFSDKQLLFLALNSKVLNIQKDSYLRVLDEKPSDFLVLLEGEWLMERKIRGVREPYVYISEKPGSWHGGIDMVDMIAPATVKVLRDSQILRIPKDVMHDMIRREFPITLYILEELRDGVIEFLDMIRRNK